jgi:metacaspase-1
MDYRVVWIHGIGQTQPGYSQVWDKVYNQYLKFPTFDDYIEVLWADVFSSMNSANNLAMNMLVTPLTGQEQYAEAKLRQNLTTVLLARATAQAQSPALVGEWSQLTQKVASGQIVLPPWLTNPDAYIGEFVKYLVNQDIRNAVKEKAKKQLRLLASSVCNCSIIAHSWGTVVAYESLLDLESEEPAFQLAHLFTLGSPLWLVQSLLMDSSGRKPRNVVNWVNVHAQGDPIGAGLTPGFQVDADFLVPTFDNADPHGSYFETGNVEVERDIVAVDIVGQLARV